jgi:YVTN family beta-propeller protein
MRYLISFILLIVCLFLFDCRKDKAQANFGNYPNDVGQIMLLKCATSGCHNNASYIGAAGLNLSTWDDMFKGSNSGSSVIPFSSKFSSLCYFINTYTPDTVYGPINYPTMPYNRSPLSKNEYMAVKNWIDQGAPDVNGAVKWADNSSRKKVYVTNQGCDVVTVFDAETQLAMRYIEVGRLPKYTESPHMIKVSPDGQYWYVIFVASSYMQKYRCSDDAFMGEVNLNNFLDWNTFVITNDGKKAYCAAWTNPGRITSVDLDNMRVISSLFPIRFPHAIALSPLNDELYVGCEKGNYMFKVDTSLQSYPTQSITLDGGPVLDNSSLNPHDMLVSPDNQNLFISCSGSNDVRVYNFTSQSVIKTIPVGTYPVEFALSPAKNKIYVTCMEDISSFPGFHGSVSRIDLSTFSEMRIQVGFMPHGIAVDEANGLVYVASRNILASGPPPHHTSLCSGKNGFVNYIDINSFTVKSKRAEVASDPYSVAHRK